MLRVPRRDDPDRVGQELLFVHVTPDDRSAAPNGERDAHARFGVNARDSHESVHERLLPRIGVNPRQATDLTVGLHDIDDAAVGQRHDGEPRDLGERRLVVERRSERDARLGQGRAPLFRPPRVRHVTEDQDGAADALATFDADGGTAVGDAADVTVAVDDGQVLGELDGHTLAERSGGRVRRGGTGLLVHGAEDLDERTADGPVTGTSRDPFGFRVDEGDDALRVRRDDAVADALERGCEALLALLGAPHVTHTLQARREHLGDRDDELALARREPHRALVDEVHRAQHVLAGHQGHRREA